MLRRLAGELAGREGRALLAFLAFVLVAPFTGVRGPASIMALPFPLIAGAAIAYAVWIDDRPP